jgi:hypothetical protein
MTALWLAVCLLTLALLLDLVLTLGLARRLRVALRAVEVSQPSAEDAFPRAGTKIGSFSVSLLSGAEVNAEDLSSGDIEAAFLSVGCEACGLVKQQLVERGPVGHQLITFVVGEPDDPAAQRLADDLSTVARDVAIVGTDGPVVNAFGVQSYPTLVSLEDGVIQRAGWRIDATNPVQAG